MDFVLSIGPFDVVLLLLFLWLYYQWFRRQKQENNSQNVQTHDPQQLGLQHHNNSQNLQTHDPQQLGLQYHNNSQNVQTDDPQQLGLQYHQSVKEGNPESKAFRKCYDDLRSTIVSQMLCLFLASKLYSEGLISRDIRDSESSQNVHVGEILLAVEHQISIKPDNFYTFMNILSKETVLETVCEKLQEAVGYSIPYEMTRIRYESPLTGEKYDEMCESFRKALMSSDANAIDRLTQSVMADSKMEKDLKVFALCYQAIEKATVLNQLDKAEEILQSALKITTEIETANKSLLRGKIYRILAGIPRRQGNYDLAKEYIGNAALEFLNAEPSCEIACVYTEEVLILQLKNNETLQQEEIEDKLRLAMKHSRACPDRRRGQYTVSLIYLRIALFHLNSYTSWYGKYQPQESSLEKAEICLQQVDLSILGGANAYEIEYRVAYSDLHRWRNERSKALEYAEEARTLQKKAKFADESFLYINRRVEMLSNH